MTRFGWLVNSYQGKRVIQISYVEFSNTCREDRYESFVNYEERDNFIRINEIEIFSKEDYLLIKRCCAYARDKHEEQCINAIRKFKRGLLRRTGSLINA